MLPGPPQRKLSGLGKAKLQQKDSWRFKCKKWLLRLRRRLDIPVHDAHTLGSSQLKGKKDSKTIKILKIEYNEKLKPNCLLAEQYLVSLATHSPRPWVFEAVLSTPSSARGCETHPAACAERSLPSPLLTWSQLQPTEWYRVADSGYACRHAGIFESRLGQKPAMCGAQCLCHPKAGTSLSMKEHWPAAKLAEITMLIWPADQQRRVDRVYRWKRPTPRL